MKILNVIATVDPRAGGPSEGVLQYAMANVRAGRGSELLVLDAPDSEWLKSFPVPVHALGPVARHFQISARLPAWLNANASRFDAIIVHGLWQVPGRAVHAASRRLSVPYFVFPHGMLDPWFKQRFPLKHLKKLVYWMLVERRVLREAAAVLFTTADEERLASKTFPLTKFTGAVVGYGIGIPRITTPDAAALFLNAWPACRGKRIILFLSRIHVKKGCDLLIQAFAQEAREDPTLHLVMGGPDDDGLKRLLEVMIRQLGISDRVTWTGMLTGEMKWGAFLAADVFALLSHQENFGMVIAESLAMGLPVLTTHSVSISEIVATEGAGYVEEATLAGAKKLLRRWLATDPTTVSTMRRRARACFDAHFHVDANATLLDRAINANVSERRAAPKATLAIVSINYAPERTGISVYSTGMAQFLARRGHSVCVYTGFPYYPSWNKSAEDKGRLYARSEHRGVQLRRCYLYVPEKPSAARRILHESTFAISSVLAYIFGARADLTIIVSPPLATGVLISMAARLKGSKVVFHVQDLQPDAAIDLGMLRKGPLTSLLFGLEALAFRMANQVSSISGAMLSKIRDKGVPATKMFLFPNWANNNLVHPLRPEESLRRDWGLNDHFIVLYAGNLGVKQALGSLLDVAKALKDDTEIAIVVVGDGAERDALIERAKKMGLQNVHFKPSVAPEDLGRMLASADVSVILQKSGIVDVVLPSKLANLLASRRPIIVAAAPEGELAAIVAQSECGIRVDPEDDTAMADAILALRADASRREAMADRGARFAKERLSESVILSAFGDRLDRILEPDYPITLTESSIPMTNDVMRKPPKQEERIR